MLRINRQTDDQGLDILKLEGRLTADFVIVLDEAVAAARPTASDTVPDQAVAAETSPSARLALDLTELSYVDQAGITALRQALGRGHAIARSPDWIRLLLAASPNTD